MPELPDITIYFEALERRVLGQPLKQLRIASPFVLRTAVPPVESVRGRTVIELRRLGKRIALGLEDDLWLVHCCPGCQTGGKLLADRSLSVLLKKDWPRTPEELEEMHAAKRAKAGLHGPSLRPKPRDQLSDS